jgi:hypothetical protein
MYLYLCVHFGIYQSIMYWGHQHILMVNQARVKLYEVKSRHSINLPSELARDSAFPFKPGDHLLARIKGEKLVIEKEGEISQTVLLPDDEG